MSNNIEGTFVAITGASSGLGEATASFRQRKAHVSSSPRAALTESSPYPPI
jgi:NADP-dependent 3-hydroxy acid dehydrogenase YdfG